MTPPSPEFSPPLHAIYLKKYVNIGHPKQQQEEEEEEEEEGQTTENRESVHVVLRCQS